MDTSRLRYHVGFWRREYVRRAARKLAHRLTPRTNQELVRALEIAGQPMEIDLSIPDPQIPLFVRESHALSVAVSLEIPAQSPVLPADGHWWPAVKVHRLRDALLDVDTGLVFCGGRVVTQSGSGHRWSRDAAFISGAFKRAKSSERTHFKGAAAPLGQCNNYYHFLIETLPRTLRIHATSSDVRFVTAVDVPSFAGSWLKEFDVEVAALPAGSVLQADDLWLCEPQPLYWPHPADLDLLGGLFTDGAGSSLSRPHRLVYISRSKGSRALPNEVFVEKEFMRHGFEVVHLEDHSPQEQVAIMKSACEVIAPHGAGLANIVFMAPGGSIVELSTGEWWWPCFRRIAHSRGLRYRLVLVNGDGDEQHLVRETLTYLGRS